MAAAKTKKKPKKAPAKKPTASVGAAGRKVAEHLGPQLADAIGIGLVVVAAISALGIWFDQAGPIGRFMWVAALGTFGIVGHAFPVVALWWGVILVRGTAEEDRGRMLVGLWMFLAGALGLISLVLGNPAPLSGLSRLVDAGGIVGSLAAWPLSKLLSVWGAGIVCFALALLGALVFTATPLAQIARALGGRDREEAPEERPRRARRRQQEPPPAEIEAVATLEDLVGEPEPEPEPEPVAAVPAPRPKRRGGGYELPPLDLLRRAPEAAKAGRSEEQTMSVLEQTLVNFGVSARVTGFTRGPTVTLFEVEVGEGTKVKKVLQLSDDIAYALATPDVRIIAPIPGKSAIGVEVPNEVRDFVMLGDVLSSRRAKDEPHPLAVGLGKDVHGRPVLVHLNRMPHVLIAGATGAGKSSLINAFVASVLMRATPDDVKLML
ncbi:MAG TPA: DNA translocase FtsK 4TM domain-containing protein, partial [Actinomycetota bacterium]|nr:DNA translocase FtsK 4TM domain-containing protein [Actinomycetota bacterium]